MVGKPNLFESVSHSTEETEHRLDVERTHSMADEGGRYPAEAESEPSSARTSLAVHFKRLPSWAWVAVGTTGAIGAMIGGVALYRYLRDRGEPALQPE